MTMRQRPLSACLRQVLHGSALLLLCAPLPALAAQDATPSSAPAKPAARPSNAPAKPAAKTDEAKAKQLGAVTVTAQSRTQEVQDVPIALQIVTAKQVDTLAATDISKIDIFVPGLVVGSTQPTQPSFELRGVQSSGNFGMGVDQPVGVYVDGVYAGSTGGALLAFNDMKRIEVLKGPQGTLFGRNAAGGAISVVTNEPSDHFEAKGRLRFGNYGERYGDALVNIPLSQDMAVRVSVMDNQSDGWVKDAATGKHYGVNDDWGTRVVYRWNLTPDTRVLLSWDHEQLKQPPHPAFGLIPLTGDTNQRAPFPADPATFLNPLHAPLYNDTVNPIEKRRFDGSTLTIDHNFGWGSLTSTTAWRNFDTANLGDYDGTNHIVDYLETGNYEHNNSWYQEFKLSGNTSLIDWVAGTSWYSEQGRQASEAGVTTDSLDTLAQNVLGAGTPLTDISNGLAAMGVPYTLLGDMWREHILNVENYKSWAVYGDVIWHLTDRLNLTTGVRFTHDQKNFSWYNPPREAPQFDDTVLALNNAGITAMLPPEAQYALAMFGQNVIFTQGTGSPVGVLVNADRSWTDVSPRAVLDYKFTPNIMGYVSVAKGYQAGGFGFQQFNSTYAPETVWNYEAGVKTLFPELNLLLNGSIYHYRYLNQQSLILFTDTTIPHYGISSSNEQATGAELELQWQPIDALQIGFNAAYIDQTYLNTVQNGIDVSGQPTGVPKYSFAAHASYTWRDVANGDVSFNWTYGYRSKTRCNAGSQSQGTCQMSPSFSVGTAQNRTDMRLGWDAAHDRWGVAVFASNLFNHRYVYGVDNTAGQVFGTPYANIMPPRTWGVELHAKF